MENISSSPLTWPEGWTRSTNYERSRFGKWNKPISIAKATVCVLEELKRMGINSRDVIISTDLKLRNDGLPYSSQREPANKGAAVWWMDGDSQKVLALDKYDRIADNLYAISKTIEAMRGIRRWGSGEILDRVFKGFTSLPSPDSVIQPPWREVFAYDGHDLAVVNAVYKKLRSKYHPDKGGDAVTFDKVVKAWADAEAELRGK